MGKKVDNLKRIMDAGFNVPSFFIISFKEIVDENKYRGLLEGIEPGKADPDTLSNIIRECIMDDSLKLIGSRLHYGHRYAIRSSCNIEDGGRLSFAGQFETYLNVGRDEAVERIIDVVLSLCGESVIEYIKKAGISFESLYMDVIIQDMVDADLSGVIFSSNPQGILNETVIILGGGAGAVVSDSSAETTAYYCNRTDDLYYYEGSKDLISHEMIDELLKITDRLKDIVGEYIDIEFAIRDDEIYILQVRDITTIKGISPLVLDNSNIVESYPGLSMPLTISFVKMVYGGVFRGVSRRVLKNDRVLERYKDIFDNMVGSANGRLYYKISNWYTMLKFLPFSGKIIPVWQEMLGVGNRNYKGEDVELSVFVRAMTYINSLYELIRVPSGMKSLDRKFRQISRKYYELYSDGLSTKDLIGIFNAIKKRLFDIWDITLLNDMYAFIFSGLLKHRLRKRGYDEEAVNGFISGISDIESMKPVNSLIDIVRNRDNYTDEEYRRVKQEYIHEYGDRSIEELKLESHTFRSDPKLFDERIEKMARSLKRYDKAVAGNAADVKDKELDLLTKWLSERASLGIANREASRLNRCRAYGMVRQIMLAIGSNYADQGLISEPRDIFMLTLQEVFEMADRPADMTAVVDKRREDYRMYENLPAYSRLVFEHGEFDKSHRMINRYIRKQDKDKLVGVPCSGGNVTARALVITDPSGSYDTEGRILVTKMTDPGWVFMLTSAAGLISEKGSLLSHTSIIARELGIPSITGVKDLLESVETGDIVSMNGNTGEIKVEKVNRGNE